jgi:predicted phage terminase large subunit-like protein
MALLDRFGNDALAFEGSLGEFMRAGWHNALETAEYQTNWHIDCMADYLTAAVDWQIKGPLIITMPPRHMKSIGINVFLPAWVWAQSVPDKAQRRGLYIRPGSWRGAGTRMAFISYGQELSNLHSTQCRSLIESPWYQKRWGDRFSLRDAQIQNFTNSVGGRRRAMSVNSGLTGFGANIICIDDAHNIESKSFELDRVTFLSKWDNVLNSRLDDRKNGIYIIGMQRSAENDLVGHILAREFNGVHVCLPAEFERHHPHVFTVPAAPKNPRAKKSPQVKRVTDTSAGTDGGPKLGEVWHDCRKAGEPLWPSRFPISALRDMQATMSSHAIAGQFQQRPTAPEGGLFKRAWFDNPVHMIPDFSRLDMYRSWDTAASPETASYTDPDYTVGVLLARDRATRVFYVIDVVRGRWGPADLERVLVMQAAMDAAQHGNGVKIRIPKDPGGAGKFQAHTFVAMLQGYSIWVEREDSGTGPLTTAKMRRAEPFAAQCENNLVKLLVGHWNQAFIDELCSFGPKSAHADQVDAVCGAFRGLTSGSSIAAVGA